MDNTFTPLSHAQHTHHLTCVHNTHTFTHAHTHMHTHANTHIAALQSVFPQTELGTFMAQQAGQGEAAEGADQHCHWHPPQSLIVTMEREGKGLTTVSHMIEIIHTHAHPHTQMYHVQAHLRIILPHVHFPGSLVAP